jgi:hypothetical protein
MQFVERCVKRVNAGMGQSLMKLFFDNSCPKQVKVTTTIKRALLLDSCY